MVNLMTENTPQPHSLLIHVEASRFSIAPYIAMLVCAQVHEPSWKNQDAALALAPVGRGEGQALFAIFDGERAQRR